MSKHRLLNVPTALAAAIALAFPVWAGAQTTNEQLLQELRELKARVGDLEKKLKDTEAKLPPAGATWGMSPDQAAELNRMSVKVDAIEENNERLGFKDVKLSGYIEPVFIYNKLQRRSGFQFLNSQSDGYFYDTSYMGAAVLDITKEMEGGTIWKLTLAPNRGVGELIGASIIQEASVSIPIDGLQTRLIAGQIPDWSGYEYQQPTLNPLTTHNLLYDFTLPTAYTGVGLQHTMGKWIVKGMVANVNTTARHERENAPVFVYRADYAKGEFSGFGFAGLHGQAPNYNFDGKNTTAHLFEVDGWYQRGEWVMGGQLGLGMQKDAAITPGANGNLRDARWWGVSGLVGYAVTPRMQLLARADYINNRKNGGGLFGYQGFYATDDDPTSPTFGQVISANDSRNGIGPELDGNLNRGANRYALTFGVKYALNPTTTLKAEYRLDGADRAVFIDAKTGEFKKHNHLLGTSLVVAF